MSTGLCKSNICNPVLWPSGSTYGVSSGIIEGCKELILTNEHLQTYMQLFRENVNRGLGKSTNSAAIVKCFPTYVQDLPDGTETGKCLALDLGGSFLKVLVVQLGKPVQVQSQSFTIPKSAMTGPGEKLFDFIADCILTFVKNQNLENENLPLGFTFSFPVIQKGLKVGILERWTKGFTCEGVIGRNVVEMLEEALVRMNHRRIEICAILNDTTGTLVAAAYKNPLSRIGLIVGTGTNGCYLESQAKAELFDEPDMGSGKVIINLEWGAFGDDGALDFVRVAYDKEVDINSVNPGKQLHEKMISGMYMGEILRLALERFTKEGLLFGGQGSDDLFTSGSIESSFVSDIERDRKGDYSNVKRICDFMGLSNATTEDYNNVRYIASCISRRAAHMVAAGLSVLLERVGEKNVAVGIDGTVYKFHPHFHCLMVEKIKEIVGNSFDYQLLLVEDGSGIGAALVAAVAAKKK